MKLGPYSMRIIGGQEMPDGYVLMTHGQQYGIELTNTTNRRCDVRLEIDGTLAGVFRVTSGVAVTIERPAHDVGCFTFFENVTPEAHAAGIRSNDSTGLIRAVFMPEWPPEPVLYASPSYAPGGTGLTGESDQGFESVRPLRYADENEFVTIHLRLAGGRHANIRSLAKQPLKNAIPPPLS